MSGALEGIIAAPMGIDYLTPLQKWQQLQQEQAQTGLVQQQAQGSGIQNQLARLNLGLRSAAASPLLAAAQGGAPGAPPGPGGGAAPTSYLPGAPAGTAPVTPVSSAPLGGPQQGGADAGGAGAPAGAAPTAATHSTGMPPPGQAIGQQVSPNGVQSMYGVPMPIGQALMALSSTDPAAAVKTVMEERRLRLQELLSQPDWQQGVTQAYQEGWMDPQHYQTMVNDPQNRRAYLSGLVSPDAYMAALEKYSGQGLAPDPNTGQPTVSGPAVAAKGAMAAAGAAGEAGGKLPYVGPTAAAQAAGAGQYETTQVTVPDPDNPGQFRTDTVLKSALPGFLGANQGARPTSASDLADPNITLGPAAYAARVRQRENPGGAPGATNPTSSATGNGQFTDGTWAATVAAAKPAWAQGMSDAQILAARADPQKAAQMSYALAQQNAPKLAAAGVPVNSLTLGLAHQFGPEGVTKVLGSPPDTPLAKVVSAQALAANPQFAHMTTGQASAQAFQTYGLNNVDLNQPAAAAAPPTQIAPGSAPGVPKLGPQGTAALGVTTDIVKKDGDAADAAVVAATAGQKAQAQLLNIRNLVPQINAGSLATAAQGVQNYLATFAPEAAQRFAAAITAGKIDPTKASATQEFVKQTLQQAGASAGDVAGSRTGFNTISLYQKAFPNLEMQPDAIKDMTNLLMIAHQRDIDYGTGANGYFLNNADAFQGGGKYNRLANYDQQFLQSNPPQVYVGAAAALNGKPFAEWAHALTPAQQQEAIRTVWRADPSATLIGPSGQQYRNPALGAQ